jgi:hypothetical protein
MVQGVAARGLAGIEIVECSPPYDSAEISSLLSARASVASAGCRHHVDVEIRIGPGCALIWRDELILGRQGSAPGRGAPAYKRISTVAPCCASTSTSANTLRVGTGRPSLTRPAWSDPC